MNITRVIQALTVIAVQTLTMNWTSAVNADELTSAECSYRFSADFRTGLPTVVGATVSKPNLFMQYSESRTYPWAVPDPWGREKIGEVGSTVFIYGGKIPRIVVEGKATEVGTAVALGETKYSWRIVGDGPGTPTDVKIPVSIHVSSDVWVAPGFNAYLKAEALVDYSSSTSPYGETLLHAFADNSDMLDLEVFDGVRSVYLGDQQHFDMRAFGSGVASTRGSPGQWRAFIDPVVRIDPTFKIMVNGVSRLASEVCRIEMSDGFLAARGEPFVWTSAADGSFGEAANWWSLEGEAAPTDGADISFTSLPDGRSYTVTLDRPRSVAAIDVADADTTLDLGGHRLAVASELCVGRFGPDPGVLRLKNGRLDCAGDVTMGLSAGVEGVVQIDAGATLQAARVVLDSYLPDMPGSGTLILAGGMLRADEVVVYGPRSALAFQAGQLFLGGGSSSFHTGSPIVVGNGTDAAALMCVSGNASFSEGLALADNALLQVRGGGQVKIWSDYVQSPAAMLALDIESAADFSTLNISGTAHLAGTLQIIVGDDFRPEPGDTFELLTAGSLDGRFDDVRIFGEGLNYAYTATGLVAYGISEPAASMLLAFAMAILTPVRRAAWQIQCGSRNAVRS